jgi:selenocysteine lyase/cysteine desulfurase
VVSMNVEKVREWFPISDDYVYMNVANHGPPSLPVQDAIKGFLDDWDRLERHGDLRVIEACECFAKLVHAEPDEVCAQPNTSMGLTAVAETLNWEGGMNVVTDDLENPANLFPWMAQRRKRVELRVVKGVGGEVRLGDVEEAVDDDTGVVAISHVQWLTGARSDLRALAEICHDHGAYLVVDGIQAAGSLAVDVHRDDVDFYACGSYKWLLGPSGAGFLYVRDEIIESLEPPFYGYRGVSGRGIEGVEYKPNAKRMELGEPSYLSFVGTMAGIGMFLELGPEEIEGRVLRLSGILHEGLSGMGVEMVSPNDEGLRSGVVSFTVGDDRALRDSLASSGFVVSLRATGIRVSADFYNTEEEVERLLGFVESFLGE